MPTIDQIALQQLEQDIRKRRDVIMQQEARLSLLKAMGLPWLQQQTTDALALLRADLAGRRETLRVLKVRIGNEGP